MYFPIFPAQYEELIVLLCFYYNNINNTLRIYCTLHHYPSIFYSTVL